MAGDTLLFILMAITLLVLVAGIVLMAIGGKLNSKYANKLMSLRVIFQLLSVVLIFVLYLYSKK